MINALKFASRLEKILTHYELSAASFADKVGVGRSSISHILSGRNKPSLDFIMKILQAFPEIDLYWLMNGKGEFRHSSASESDSVREASAPISLDKENHNVPAMANTKKEIAKVIICYKDGSFESYES